jgi:GAF domain-containing protein
MPYGWQRGCEELNEHWRERLICQLELGDTLDEIEGDLQGASGLSEDERSALWLFAWSEDQRNARDPARSGPALIGRADEAPIVEHAAAGGVPTDPRSSLSAALAVAHRELDMDVAVLGEVVDGHEVVRFVSGDAASFGFVPGASAPLEETFCRRLLEGRVSNIVRDALEDEDVRDLQLTKLARIGAYIGVPLTTLDARLYILCCLAHEQRPALGERDVRFLRGLGETVIAELSAQD